MTITFTELESTHETADGVHRRRLRSYGFTGAGTTGVHRRRIHSYGVPIAGAGDFDPEIPATGVHDRNLRSGGTAFSGAFAEGEHGRSLSSTGIAGADNEAGGTHYRRLTSWGRIDDENAGYGLLVAQPFVVSSYGDQWFVNVFESLRIGASLDLLPMQRVREVVAFSRLLRSQFEGRGLVADGVAFGDDPIWTVLQVVEDQEGVREQDRRLRHAGGVIAGLRDAVLEVAHDLGGCRERVGRRDDLIARTDIESHHCKEQRVAARGTPDSVLDPTVGSELCFQRSDFVAEYKRVSIENAAESLFDLRPQLVVLFFEVEQWNLHQFLSIMISEPKSICILRLCFLA